MHTHRTPTGQLGGFEEQPVDQQPLIGQIVIVVFVGGNGNIDFIGQQVLVGFVLGLEVVGAAAVRIRARVQVDGSSFAFALGAMVFEHGERGQRCGGGKHEGGEAEVLLCFYVLAPRVWNIDSAWAPLGSIVLLN